MSKTTTAYQFDSNGYLIGGTLVMSDPRDGGWLVPSDCTLTEPKNKKDIGMYGIKALKNGSMS